MQSRVPRMDQSPGSTQATDCQAEYQLCWKGPEGGNWHQSGHEATACPGNKEGQLYPGKYEQGQPTDCGKWLFPSIQFIKSHLDKCQNLRGELTGYIVWKAVTKITEKNSLLREKGHKLHTGTFMKNGTLWKRKKKLIAWKCNTTVLYKATNTKRLGS